MLLKGVEASLYCLLSLHLMHVEADVECDDQRCYEWRLRSMAFVPVSPAPNVSSDVAL